MFKLPIPTRLTDYLGPRGSSSLDRYIYIDDSVGAPLPPRVPRAPLPPRSTLVSVDRGGSDEVTNRDVNDEVLF